jgi:hypothetical protein
LLINHLLELLERLGVNATNSSGVPAAPTPPD